MASSINAWELFWDKVDGSGECWLWTGYTTKQGYGQFVIDGKTRLAHHVSLMFTDAKRPDGYQCDHLCKTKNCVNPSHLEWTTGIVNNYRSSSPSAINAKKSYCKSGHPLFGDNLYTKPNGYRRCRTCHREYTKVRMRRVRTRRSL